MSALILKKSFAEFDLQPRKIRKIIDLKELTFAKKINPLTYVSGGLLFFYQNVLSEQISASCTHEISCSEFTKKAIEKRGLFVGALIGINQLSSCFNGVEYEHCESAISENGKIINQLE